MKQYINPDGVAVISYITCKLERALKQYIMNLINGTSGGYITCKLERALKQTDRAGDGRDVVRYITCKLERALKHTC